jgi:hypothetical protein
MGFGSLRFLSLGMNLADSRIHHKPEPNIAGKQTGRRLSKTYKAIQNTVKLLASA